MMTESIQNPNCPKCGAPISNEAPAGLCPKCVLGGAATIQTSTTPGGRTAPPSVDDIAAHFPEMEIGELIGAGGMGAVYKARQPKLDRMVALKILTQDLADDPAFVERFNREARMLAKLNHPNIVTVFSFGTAGPFCYLEMEFVDGVNLRQAMAAGGFTPTDALGLVQNLCAALGFAHEEGITHRDIKPENILIDTRGRVKIADFGIAKLAGTTERHDVTLTIAGSVLGSPQYMAPEQIETPGEVDHRADIYSLGVVFYELLTGELPLGRFGAPSEKKAMDSRIDEIVFRTLEKEREARFQSAGEVETQIGAITEAGSLAPNEASSSKKTAKPAPGDIPQTAKFATAAAICTGLGLLAALIGFVYISLMGWTSSAVPKDAIAAITTLLVSFAGIPLLLGIILGGIALGEIRSSNGRKAGLGSAMFGALTVPVLIVVAAAAMMIPFALKVPSLSTLLLATAALVAIGGLFAAWHLVRTVGAWAKGDSAPRGPIEGGRVVSSSVLAGGVVLLTVAVFNLWPMAGHDNYGTEPRPPESRVEMSPPNYEDPYQELWDTHWNEGSPEFNGELSVAAGHTAVIQLQAVESGSRDTTTLLWEIEAPDNEDYRGLISLGAPKALQERQSPGVAALHGTLWDSAKGIAQSYDKFFNGVLKLDIRQRRIELDGETPFDVKLGALFPVRAPDGSQGSSTLYLRIQCVPRAASDGAGVAETLPASAPIAEIEMAYTAPAGQISVFALQAPWDKDHESPDDWYVVAPDDADLNGRITFTMTSEHILGRGPSRAVVATLLDGDGEPLKTHRFFAPENHTMSLPLLYPTFEIDDLPDGEIIGGGDSPTSPESIDLNRAGLHMIVFGHEEGSEVVDSLRLLAWSMPKPDGANTEDWMTHRFKRLNEKKGKPQAEGRDMFQISQMEGDIRARSGFLFDTRERALNPKKTGLPSVPSALNDGKNFVVDTLKRGGSLILPKGSKATLESFSGGKFLIGPQVSDALLILDMDTRWILPLPENALDLQVDKLPGGELTIVVPPYASFLSIREPAAFQLGSDGKLQVFEGEVVVAVGGSDERILTSGQAFTLPQPTNAQ